MTLPIRMAIRVDFDDGSQHEYEVRSPQAVDAPFGEFWPEGVVTSDVAARMEYDHKRSEERDFFLHLLRIAADDEDLDPDQLEFAVITGGRTLVPGDANGPLRGQTVRLPEVRYWPFKKGEIIVLPVEGGREPLGDGRSVYKYDVAYERFGRDYEAAKQRSDEVKAAPDRDAFAPPEAVR